MIPARKRWGQHFLVGGRTAQRIVEAASLRPTDTVIEVGPGEGALTRPLAGLARRLLAVEIDPLRVEKLSREFAGNERVRILPGDVLEKRFGDWLEEAGWAGPAVLVANLPYNVATPILTAAIEEPRAICRSIVTVQREVARRFAARPSEEGYGYLTVRAEAFARARVLFDLPPGAFRPAPRVTSSVLELTPRGESYPSGAREKALRLASLGFQSRRKTLANALSSVASRAVWEEALGSLGKDRRARAEELSFGDFVLLTERVP